MDKELIKEILEYMECVEVKIECEWGYCRSLGELVDAGEMPELYTKLKATLDNLPDD